MRTVVKSVIRSLSASAASTVSSTTISTTASCQMNRQESTSILCGTADNFKRNHLTSESNIVNSHEKQGLNKDLKPQSLSPCYKLNPIEEYSFEYLLDRECDYYPDISNRGDQSILCMDFLETFESEEKSATNNAFSVDSDHVKSTLKTIRFVNDFVFNTGSIVFLNCCNYLQRLLDKKAVKKDLMPFITAAVYDIATEQYCGKALNNDQIALLLHLSGIPINHIEDFNRMKHLLLNKLNKDIHTISLNDYLKILLRLNGNSVQQWNDSNQQLINIACVLATSCELTHFTLACQSISLLMIAARHINFTEDFKWKYSKVVLDKFPMMFVSPVRLNYFAQLANISEETIKHCTESIVRYYYNYYYCPKSAKTNKSKQSIKRICQPPNILPTIVEVPEIEIDAIAVSHKLFNISELIVKLNELTDHAHIIQFNGKQRQHHKRIKKKLTRQLRKYRKFHQLDTNTNCYSNTTNCNFKQKPCLDFDCDSAFSSLRSSPSKIASISVSPQL